MTDTSFFGLPFESRAVIVMSDWDEPSCTRISGCVARLIDKPSSEGPVSAGVSWLLVVQPAAVAANATAHVMIHRINDGFFIFESPPSGDAPLAYLTMSLGISEIGERHVDVSCRAYFSAGLVMPVEGHHRDRGQDDWICGERF